MQAKQLQLCFVGYCNLSIATFASVAIATALPAMVIAQKAARLSIKVCYLITGLPNYTGDKPGEHYDKRELEG